jgi:hypothetical protein
VFVESVDDIRSFEANSMGVGRDDMTGVVM